VPARAALPARADGGAAGPTGRGHAASARLCRGDPGQGEGVEDVKVSVDGLGAELGADDAGAQGDIGVLLGPLPPTDKPSGDVTGAGSDRGGGGWVESHGVHAWVGSQKRVAPHAAVPALCLLQNVLGSAHQAVPRSS
jgi:hypothetical protein